MNFRKVCAEWSLIEIRKVAALNAGL